MFAELVALTQSFKIETAPYNGFCAKRFGKSLALLIQWGIILFGRSLQVREMGRAMERGPSGKNRREYLIYTFHGEEVIRSVAEQSRLCTSSSSRF